MQRMVSGRLTQDADEIDTKSQHLQHQVGKVKQTAWVRNGHGTNQGSNGTDDLNGNNASFHTD